MLALTATATVDVQRDIVRQLGRPDMQPFVYGFDRPNLVYRVLSLNGRKAKLQALQEVLAAQRDGSTIIYTATRRAAQEVAVFLQERGAEVLLYHAGLSDAARKQAQDAFMERPNGLIVATNAFGMGIDKPDVRGVVHFNLPRSLEAYYQEAGRAGRDGAEAQCVLLFSYGDVRIQEFLIEHNNPTRQVVERLYELVAGTGPPGTDVPLSALLRHLGRGSSALQLAAAARLLEKAGYVEQMTAFEAGRRPARPARRTSWCAWSRSRLRRMPWCSTTPCGGENTNWPKSAAWSATPTPASAGGRRYWGTSAKPGTSRTAPPAIIAWATRRQERGSRSGP